MDQVVLTALEKTLEKILIEIGHTKKEAKAGVAVLMNNVLNLACLYIVMENPTVDKDVFIQELQQKKPADIIPFVFSLAKDTERIEQAFEDAFRDILGWYYGKVGMALTEEQKQNILKIYLHFSEEIKFLYV